MRVSFYIDGFNFYYLAVKKTPYKWLDFKALFSKLLQPGQDLVAIKYYTAVVSGMKDPNKPIRQQTYLRALKAFIPEVSIHYGSFLTNKKWMPVANPGLGSKFAEVIKTEEKGSDVNLAVNLVNDAWKNLYDCAVVVSNDSDLSEALRIIKTELNKSVGVFIPWRAFPSKDLLKYADFIKHIRRNLLENSQLPNPIPNTNIFKPIDW
jgi:Protein of unknown function DUF88.